MRQALSHEISHIYHLFSISDMLMIEIVRYLKCHTYQNLAILFIHIP